MVSLLPTGKSLISKHHNPTQFTIWASSSATTSHILYFLDAYNFLPQMLHVPCHTLVHNVPSVLNDLLHLVNLILFIKN